MSKIVLVKMVVQPTFIVMDGDEVQREVVEEPRVVQAQDWPSYSGTQFPKELAEAQAQLDTEAAEKPKPNRATRRAKKS